MKEVTVLSFDIFQTLVDVNKRIPHIWKGILKENYTEELAYKEASTLMSNYAIVLHQILYHDSPFLTMKEAYLKSAILSQQQMDSLVEPELVVEQLLANHAKAPYYDDVWEILPKLKEKYRICLSSDSSHTMADSIIMRVQPEYAFISDDLECYKGQPDGIFFHKVAKKLQVAPENILHIGDSSSDVIGALGAGVRVVWLNRQGAKWKHMKVPDYEISSLRELPEILNSLENSHISV